MKNSMLKKIIVLLFFFILLLFSLGMISQNSVISFWGTKTSVEEKKYLYRVGKVEFWIPRNYIWRWSSPKGSEVFGANLHFIYPELKGKNKNNLARFKTVSENRPISIVLSKRGERTFLNVEERFFVSEESSVIESSITGFKVIKIWGDSELYIPNELDKNNFYFTCNNKKGAISYPSCAFVLAYKDNVTVKGHFSKAYLSEAKGIADSIIILLDKFTEK